MQRFKNIVAVYDIVPGGDEAIQKATLLAKRNDACLTIVHAINPLKDERLVMAERNRLMKRISAGIQLPARQKRWVVQQGMPAEVILNIASRIQADLIITPQHDNSLYDQFMGFDTSARLMRQAAFPTWVLRPKNTKTYHRIVVPVNAGKAGALENVVNHRMLEIASSLAVQEGARLDILYAWDYESHERDMILSELPRGQYEEITNLARLRNLGHIINLVEHVLGDFSHYKAVPLRGEPRSVIVDYINQNDTDLLIIDGEIDGAIKSVFFDNLATHLLYQSRCSVLCTRRAPARSVSQNREAA